MKTTMGQYDEIRNGRFEAFCKVFKLDSTDTKIQHAFWAGIAAGLLEQLQDDARTTKEAANRAFADYLKGAK